MFDVARIFGLYYSGDQVKTLGASGSTVVANDVIDRVCVTIGVDHTVCAILKTYNKHTFYLTPFVMSLLI